MSDRTPKQLLQATIDAVGRRDEARFDEVTGGSRPVVTPPGADYVVMGMEYGPGLLELLELARTHLSIGDFWSHPIVERVISPKARDQLRQGHLASLLSGWPWRDRTRDELLRTLRLLEVRIEANDGREERGRPRH